MKPCFGLPLGALIHHQWDNVIVVSFILQLCFRPACHFHLKLPRVQWATASLGHLWWAMVVSVSADNENMQPFLSLFMSVCEQVDLLTLLTSTEEEEEVGEEEVAEEIMTTFEDKVATWGSHTTWGEHTGCVIYEVIFYRGLSVFLDDIELCIFSFLVFLLGLKLHQNVTRWPTQHHWVSWPGRSRRHGLLLEHSRSPLQSFVQTCILFCLLSTVD